LASAISLAEVKLDNNKLNRIYKEFGGTNAVTSKIEKVDFIRTQQNYNPTSQYAKFLGDVRIREIPDSEPLYKTWRYLLPQ